MNCTEFKELVGAYALGTLDPEERAACDRHLQQDSHQGCLAALQAANDGIALLGRALAPVQPSPQLWAAIEGRLRAPERRRRPATAWVGWAAAAAALVLLVWVARDRQRLELALAQANVERDRMAGEQKTCDTALASSTLDARQLHQVLDLLPRTESRLVALAPQADATATAKVLFDPGVQRGYLIGQGLQAPTGKDYELWLIRGDQKIPAGLLRGQPRGALVAAIDPGLLAGPLPDAIAVTLEPTGGGTAPTGPIVLVGKI